MKKCICIILVIVVSILSGCNSSQNEENVFPQNLKKNITRFRLMKMKKKSILYQMLKLR